MKRFQLSPWDLCIEQIDVRPNDEPKYSHIYLTWADAHAALLTRCKDRVRDVGLALKKAEGELNTVKGMKP